jgi:oleandomycin transport system permease protein
MTISTSNTTKTAATTVTASVTKEPADEVGGGVRHEQTARPINPVRAARHAMTLAWRNIVKLRHSPEALLDVTLQPIIFVLLFVFIFGGAVSHSWHSYLTFVMPGLMAQTVVFGTMGIGVALATDLSKGVFDRFRSMPIARSAPLIGAVLGEIVRYSVSVLVLVGFSMSIGYRFHEGMLGAIAACLLALLFALSMSWITTLLGLVLGKPEAVQGLGFVVMFPLTFGSNVFTQTATMPGWVQAWVKINPVTHLVDAVRGLTNGGAVASPVLWTLGWCAALVAVFAPLAVNRYRRQT